MQKVVGIAITQNDSNMLTLVLPDRTHAHFTADIRHTVINAAHNGHTPIIKHTYHLAADAFNDLTIFRANEELAPVTKLMDQSTLSNNAY